MASETSGILTDKNRIKGTSDGGTTFHDIKTNADGEIAVNLETSDIEIGAVEMKDATTDTRAVVKSDGTNNALVVTQNAAPTTTVEQATATSLQCEPVQPTAADLNCTEANSGAIKTAVETLDNCITGNQAQVDLNESIGVVSTNNSSTSNLGIDEVFTGTADEIKNYAAISIAIFADQASATDGLSLEWSQDGTNWDEKMTVSIAANNVESYEFGIRAMYFRIVYTNGGTAQGAFRLQTIFHPTRTRQGARCLCVDISPREFASTRRAILAAKKPDESYTNINATAGGNLKTSIEEFAGSLPAGTNVIGKVRPVTAGGDELSNDTEDFVQVSGAKLWNHKETVSISSGTTGTYTVPKNMIIRKIHMRIPTMTSAGNAKITFETQTDGYVIYDSGNKAETDNYTLSFDDELAANDVIKVTIDVSDTADIILDMYGLILQ